VDWRWTRGHSGDRWNERADQLASQAMPRPPLPVEDAGAVHLFAAAAQSGKAAAGGWGVVLHFEDSQRALSGQTPGASANRMHLQAAVAGLESLKRPMRVHLYTTSDYLKDGATAWVAGWRSRGWTTREGKPVSHRDLWQALSRLAERHQVHWHVASREQLPVELEQAKRLATAAAKGEVDG
jgi:ribonuclease HI